MNWNPFIALLKLAAPYLIVALLVGGAYGWAHHRGVVAQRDKDAKVIAALKSQIVIDDNAVANWKKAGEAWNKAIAAQDDLMAAAAKRAADALAQARARAKAADRALQAALKHPPVCPGQMLPDGVLQ